MTSEIKCKSASTISAAFDEACNLVETWSNNEICWFRGVKDNSLKLQPGACWRGSYAESEPLVTFAQEGAAFADVGSIDQWPFYYLAQHHGIPTRLLDWTESFSTALFFAFEKWDGTTTPCIWIVKPGPFNEIMMGWSGILAPENTSDTEIWLPRFIDQPAPMVRQTEGYTYDNSRPLAIYPKKSNHRIVAQQGAFTVHGREPDPLDVLYGRFGGEVDDTFVRIDLEGFDKSTVLSHLALLGIRRSAIYPDLDNFVQELREYYGWDK